MAPYAEPVISSRKGGVVVTVLTAVAIPGHVPDTSAQESLWRQMTFGIRYIREQTPLLLLLSVLAASNFLISLSNPLAVPMVLARMGQRAFALALVQSAAGIGGAVGGFLMGVWGGPRDKVRGILLGDSLNFIALSLCVFLGRTPLVWATGFLVSSCLGTIVNGLSQPIWQAKVPSQYKERVSSTKRRGSRSIGKPVCPEGQTG